MIGIVKHLNPGGESITTNVSDSRLVLNNGVVLTPFGEQSLPSYTCRHCNHVVYLQSVNDRVEQCNHCRSTICDVCAFRIWNGKDTCRPFKEEGGDCDLYERGKIKILR